MSKRKRKRKNNFVDGLSLKALLQIQAQGICVAPQLTKLGHQDKITVHSVKQAEAIQQYGVRESLNLNKYKVSAKDLRTADGIVFASKSEMLCYKLLKASGIPFQLQPAFELQPSMEVEGKHQRAIVYCGDFLISDTPRTDSTAPLRPGEIVIDVKGMRLPLFLLKKKMFAAKFSHQIVEIKNASAMTQFIHEYKNKEVRSTAQKDGVSG